MSTYDCEVMLDEDGTEPENASLASKLPAAMYCPSRLWKELLFKAAQEAL